MHNLLPGNTDEIQVVDAGFGRLIKHYANEAASDCVTGVGNGEQTATTHTSGTSDRQKGGPIVICRFQNSGSWAIKLRSKSMYPSLIVVAKKSAAPSALRIQDAKSKLTHSDAWPCLTANELFKD